MKKIYEDVYIAFGANLSNPQANFSRGLERLAAQGVGIQAMSGLWQSPAWPPGSAQPDYINAAAKVSFAGSAAELLAILHAIEAKLGRVRGEKNAARTLDLDLLDFKGQVISTDALTVPHPRMLTRAFVLFPLQQIAPDWRDPQGHQAIDNHIAKLPLSDVAPLSYLGHFKAE